MSRCGSGRRNSFDCSSSRTSVVSAGKSFTRPFNVITPSVIVIFSKASSSDSLSTRLVNSSKYFKNKAGDWLENANHVFSSRVSSSCAFCRASSSSLVSSGIEFLNFSLSTSTACSSELAISFPIDLFVDNCR